MHAITLLQTLLSFPLLLALCTAVHEIDYAPRTVRYNITLATGVWNADCTEKYGLLINGASPGPAIQVTLGDLVVVQVVNDHTKDITLHFHGITQHGTPSADGVPGVSQIAIPPGATYEYRWRAQNSGTHFYHAHTRLDASSVYGALIVHDPHETLEYDEERLLLLNDYWHKEEDKLYDGLMSKPMRWIDPPHSILINGKARDPRQMYGNDNTSSTSLTVDCEYNIIPVDQGKTYRLRIINAAGWAYLSLDITGHTMVMVEADGYHTKPFTTDHLEIAPGQRYSVLLTTDQDINSYWIRANPIWTSGRDVPTGSALLTYRGITRTTTLLIPPGNTSLPRKPDWILPEVHAASNSPGMPEKADATLTLTISPIFSNHVIQRHAVNNISYMDTSSPSGKSLLDRAYESLLLEGSKDPSIFLASVVPSLSIYPKGTVVDVVIQLDGKSCLDPHPWHLHGHSYWDLGQGSGLYTEAEGEKVIPISPLYRDTSMVFPQEDTRGANGCGWRRIRVKLDNPGIWPIHCHIHAHMIMGMMWLIGVGLDELPPRTPLVQGGWVGSQTSDNIITRGSSDHHHHRP
ncbi:MAG: Cupredoxin [Piptocephalis tieghemiana]|nr:MAG: Cupredoxin [Piptocephalis tieghemiana]